MGRSVGIDQSIKAEVAVVLQFAVVAAIPVHCLTVVGQTFVDGMIAPLPDKTAAESGVLLSQVKIFLEIAGTVAH